MLIRGPNNTVSAENGASSNPQHHSKVIRLEKGHGIEVSMTITAQGNGPQAEPAVIRTTPVKDVFWFKAIKAYIFGKIELRFEVINKSGYLNEAQLPEPLVFTIDVSVDIHGNKAPDTSMLVGLGDGSYYDYVYEESSDGGAEEDNGADSDDGYGNSTTTRSNKNTREKSHQNTGGGSNGSSRLSKYDLGTIYDKDYFSKPRHSYAPGSGSHGAGKRPRYSAGSSSEMQGQGDGDGQSDRKKISRTSVSASTATYGCINRSISPSPESDEASCSHKDFGDITVMQKIHQVQHQLLLGQDMSGGDNDDVNGNVATGVGSEFVEGRESDEEVDGPMTTNSGPPPGKVHERALRFRSYSRDPGDIESEGEGNIAQEGVEWANHADSFAAEGRREKGDRAGDGQHTVNLYHTLLERPQGSEWSGHGAECRGRARENSPPRMKVTSNADIAYRNASSSNANKAQPAQLVAERQTRGRQDLASKLPGHTSATGTGNGRASRSQRIGLLPSEDQLDFLDPLQTPEQAYLRINNLLNVKGTQPSLLHAIEVSFELDTLLTNSRNDTRRRNKGAGAGRKTEEEMYYKTMAQRLQQLRGMLEARKALDAALLSLLNQGCGM